MSNIQSSKKHTQDNRALVVFTAAVLTLMGLVNLAVILMVDQAVGL